MGLTAVLLDAGSSAVPAAAVVGIPVGETFELEGGTLRTNAWFGSALHVADTRGTVLLRGAIDAEHTALVGHSVVIERCHGPVIGHAATFAVVQWSARDPMVIRDSDQVAFTGSVLNDTVHVTNSSVTFTDTDLAWGLRVESGSVTVADGLIQGPSQPSGIGEPGVILTAGEIALAGSMTILTRAWGPLSAIQTLGGLVRIGPGVTLVSSLGAPGIAGPAPAPAAGRRRSARFGSPRRARSSRSRCSTGTARSR